ncbi:hypothetical protein [Streptomyces candidus]|uniref:Uncharacterized protein n=1 Tax=Streptomyces candidus TaxID=67283 RepID=A0A7X0HI47_9ACTN|nr:hypothetical protein [Streptomyces candidus]MBB6437975.1 hypothetical protein [Streptomyces candidus]GHH39788.1 hypothetical protein GCM10018773_20250 [Streptomyces candidus]
MTASQQHLLDAHRAARHGSRTPPAPGRHDRQTLRELGDAARDGLRFRSVAAGQPGRSFLRAACARLADRLRAARPTGTARPTRTGRTPRARTADRS